MHARMHRVFVIGLTVALVVMATVSTAPGGPAGSTRPVVIVQGTDVPTLDPQFSESGHFGNIQHQMWDFLIPTTRTWRSSLMPPNRFGFFPTG